MIIQVKTIDEIGYCMSIYQLMMFLPIDKKLQNFDLTEKYDQLLTKA